MTLYAGFVHYMEETMDELIQMMLYHNEQLGMLIHDHPAATVLTFVVIALVGEQLYARIWGRRPMDPKHDRFVNECFADIVTDGVEAYVEYKLLTREDADILYKRVANHLKAYDLLPRRSMSIPQEIRRRLWYMWKKTAKATAGEMHARKPKRSAEFK